MILVFRKGCISKVSDILVSHNVTFSLVEHEDREIIFIENKSADRVCLQKIKSLDCFLKEVNVNNPFPLVSREYKSQSTEIKVNNRFLGAKEKMVIAGPCAIENYEQARDVIQFLLNHNINIIRGGLFKPRTSPYSFQGLRDNGVDIVRQLKKEMEFSFASEVLIPAQMEILEEIVDIWQVGTRSMANYDLLKELGRSKKPIILKRGIMATIEEWLLAAEYILKEGNSDVILCERGIRTFEPLTRFTFDINAIPVVKELSHLPIIADPSHAVGKRNWVLPLAKAALIAGADGIIVEVHPDPDKALSDSEQSLSFPQFEQLLRELKELNL